MAPRLFGRGIGRVVWYIACLVPRSSTSHEKSIKRRKKRKKRKKKRKKGKKKKRKVGLVGSNPTKTMTM